MLPLTVYGSLTCEDTAAVRDRLRALGIAYTAKNSQDEPEVASLLARLNHGHQITPTLVLGDEKLVISEPTFEQLEDMLRDAGYTFTPPTAIQFQDERSKRPAPDFTLASTDGGEFQLSRQRGRRRAVLFFSHAHDCRVCQGYARLLTSRRERMEELNARPVLILPDELSTARTWADEFARGGPALADPGGRVRQDYARYFGFDPTGVALFVLDTYIAPRAGSYAPDAGSLISPAEVLRWLHLLDLECDE